MGFFSTNRENKIKMIIFLLLTVGYFLVELIVGQMTNSMALVADAFHMLSDVVALVVAFLCMLISPKKWAKNTFGFARAEVLGALSNAVFLIALCFSIVVESIKKFIDPEEIKDPKLVLIVGATGLGLNLFGLVLFSGGGGGHEHSHGGGTSHGHSHGAKKHSHNHNEEKRSPDVVRDKKEKSKISSSQMNIRGVFLHVLGDALGSVVVIVSALVVWLTEWEYKKYIDPSLSLVIVLIIFLSTIPLLKESSLVLMQNIPDDYDVEELKSNLIQAVPEIFDIHELHLWRLVGNKLILTLHVSLKLDVPATDQMVIARRIKDFFHSQGIHSTTIQLESSTIQLQASPSSSEFDSLQSPFHLSCLLKCPPPMNDDASESSAECKESLCCSPKTEEANRKLLPSGRENPLSVDVEGDLKKKGYSSIIPMKNSKVGKEKLWKTVSDES